MLSAKEIAGKWEGIAKTKASLGVLSCVLLGILAGMYIAFGALGCTIVQNAVGGGMGKFLGACVFPAGLILVVMAGGELFTGNCLMAGPAVKKAIGWGGLLRNWGLVYLGNMAGALLLALIAYYGGFFNQAELAKAAGSIAVNKCALSFGQAFLRGVGCNVLVCGAVWMASGAENAAGKAVCCFFPVMLFVLCGFEHSVANMYYIPLGMLTQCGVSAGDYVLHNLLPVTLGNITGGGVLALIYAAVYRK